MMIKDIVNAVVANNMSAQDAEREISQRFIDLERSYDVQLANARRPHKTWIAITVPLSLGFLALMAYVAQNSTIKTQAELEYKLKTQGCREESFTAGYQACKHDTATLLDTVKPKALGAP